MPSAGSRDSPLTNHGVLQTKRLGAYLAKRHTVIGPVKHIFTSNLQRAYQTAEAVAEAQGSLKGDSSASQVPLEVCRLPELREKDYGSSEGKKYGVKDDGKVDKPDPSDLETHDSMRIRVDHFLDFHLIPVIDKHASDNAAVAVVAHGIILGVLFKALLERFPSRSTIVTESVTWSNTGVLQAKLELRESVPLTDPPVSKDGVIPHIDRALGLKVELINNIEHLEGLKKTRGGIGSAKFDSRQRTMDSFFTPTSKKRKVEETRNP